MDPEQTTTETPSTEFTPCPDCPSPDACRSAGSCLLETEAAAAETTAPGVPDTLAAGVSRSGHRSAF